MESASLTYCSLFSSLLTSKNGASTTLASTVWPSRPTRSWWPAVHSTPPSSSGTSTLLPSIPSSRVSCCEIIDYECGFIIWTFFPRRPPPVANHRSGLARQRDTDLHGTRLQHQGMEHYWDWRLKGRANRTAEGQTHTSCRNITVFYVWRR